MNNRRLALRTLCCLVLALLVLGNGLGALAQGYSPEGKVSIRFAALVSNEHQLNGWTQIIQAYKAHQPNVDVELVRVEWEDERTWLTMQLIGGTAPDVFHTKHSWAVEDYNKGLLMSLEDMFAAKNPYTDTDTWQDFYADNVITQMRAVFPTLVGACNYVNICKTFYNKQIFADCGIDKLPENWNEFLEVQQVILDKGYTPFAFPNSVPADNMYNWSERLLTYQLVEGIIPELDINGSGIVEANEIVRGVDMGIIDLTKPPFSEVFPILKDWSKYWSQGYNSINDKTAHQMFYRGEAAMMMALPEVTREMQEMGVEFEYGVFSFPMLTKDNSEFACEKYYEMGGAVAETYAIPVTTQGEQLKAAQDFLYFLGSPEAMQIAADVMFYMPTAKESVSDALNGWEPVGQTVKMNLYGPAIDQLFSDDTVMYGQLYLEGSITLEEYLNEMQASILDMKDRLMESNGWTAENNYSNK